MLKKPVLKWKNDPNALYTLLIEDNDITNQPIKYAHWLVTNIKGNCFLKKFPEVLIKFKKLIFLSGQTSKKICVFPSSQ